MLSNIVTLKVYCKYFKTETSTIYAAFVTEIKQFVYFCAVNGFKCAHGMENSVGSGQTAD